MVTGVPRPGTIVGLDTKGAGSEDTVSVPVILVFIGALKDDVMLVDVFGALVGVPWVGRE